MNVVDRYSTRTAAYARFRWDYAAKAIETLLRECGLCANAAVADIGSGTGLVARHFVDRVRTVFAVEPNSEMRRLATEALGGYRSYRSVNGFSDATTLQDSCVRLITVGRALHWFPTESTRAEFYRILEAEGWLAILSVPCTDSMLLDSFEAVRTPVNGWDLAVDKKQRRLVPLSVYFGHDTFRTLTAEGFVRETWEAFLGRISSMAAAPALNHPLRLNFERALRDVFERHADNGVLSVSNATQIAFGQVNRLR